MSNITDWNVGDVVRLKSGGPLMTVNGKADNYGMMGDDVAVPCVWFEGAEKKEHKFSVDVLTKVESNEGN